MSSFRNPSPLQAIVFDFGGVLIDWNPRYLYRQFFNTDEAVERFLTEIGFFEWNQHQDAGRSFSEAVAELTAQHPRYADLIRAYDERYEECLSGPIQGTVEILKALRSLGFPLYGLSNWPAEKFAGVRQKHAFFELFDDIVLSGEVGITKPDPRIFLLLLERIGRPAQDCLFIDDAEANLAAARALGFRTVLFQDPRQLRQVLAGEYAISIQPE